MRQMRGQHRTAFAEASNATDDIDSIPKCVKRHGGIDPIPKTRQTPRRHRPHSENASNATVVSAAPGWGVFSRQLCGTWTGPQQQGSPGTCGEERRALRPAPGAGRRHPTLALRAPTHQPQPLSRRGAETTDVSTAPSPSGRPTPNRIILHRRNKQQSRVQPSPRHPVDLVQRLKRIGSARATPQFLHTLST